MKKVMSFAMMQKQAGPELLAMASNMSSRKGGFPMEVWADREPKDLMEAGSKAEGELTKKAMRFAMLQKQAGLELLAMGGLPMEVWADRGPKDLMEAGRKAEGEVKKKASSCAMMQKQAGPELLAMASNMSSRKGGFQIEVWADREPKDLAEASRKKLKGSDCVFTTDSDKRFAEEECFHRLFQGKENVNPSGQSDSCLSSLPSWRPRYPLQDITALIHSLQSIQVDSDAGGLALSGRSELKETKKCRPVFPISCKNTANKKSSQLLLMR